jgi:hypothetical protein
MKYQFHNLKFSPQQVAGYVDSSVLEEPVGSIVQGKTCTLNKQAAGLVYHSTWHDVLLAYRLSLHDRPSGSESVTLYNLAKHMYISLVQYTRVGQRSAPWP